MSTFFTLTFHSILLSFYVLSLTTSFCDGSFLRLRKDGSLSFLFTHSVCLGRVNATCLHLYFVRHGSGTLPSIQRTHFVGTIFRFSCGSISSENGIATVDTIIYMFSFNAVSTRFPNRVFIPLRS